LPVIASLARIMRSAMIDALGQDYIRTARSKGLGEWTVTFKHALRNSLIPYVTALGIMAGYLFSGAIVVEQVYAIPGLGRLMLGAIADRNYPLIQTSILVVTCAFVIINAVIDLLYRVIDKRAGVAA
jgi:peptide/nickel transport system permease protein